MANNLSDYLSNALQNHVLNGTAYPSPSATVAIALCTAQPTGATLNEHPNTNGYARTAFTDWTTATSPAGLIKNNSAIIFAAASGNWTEVTHVAICDSATYGGWEFLYWGLLDTAKTLTNGDVFQFDANQLTITIH